MVRKRKAVAVRYFSIHLHSAGVLSWPPTADTCRYLKNVSMKKENNDKISTVYQEGMIAIHGEVFDTDFKNDLLLPVDRNNYPSDIHAFAKGLDMTGYYQPSSGKLLPEKDPTDPTLKFFEIPLEYVDQAHRIPSEHMEEINAEAMKGKKGFMMVTQEMADRLNGYLPSIEYDGVRYLIDIERNELLAFNHSSDKIVLNADAHSEPSTIYYNKSSKSQIRADDLPANNHQEIVLVHFPPLSSLDIVGYCKMSGLPPASLICEVPWRADASKIKQEQFLHAVKANLPVSENETTTRRIDMPSKNKLEKTDQKPAQKRSRGKKI